jgi:O-antigen ligase
MWIASSQARIPRLLLLPTASLALGALVVSRSGTHVTELAAAAVGLLALSYVFSQHLDRVLVWWVALEGVSYAFVRYPLHHNLVTLDRVVMLGVAGALFLSPRPQLTPQTRRLYRAFIAFVLLYGARAFLTHQLPTAPGYQPFVRFQLQANWLDQAALPLIAFAAAIRVGVEEVWLKLARSLTFLGTSVAVLGLAEWKLGFELATLSHASVFSDVEAGVIRVGGPYADPTTYGGVLVICIAATCYWIRQSEARLLASVALLLEVFGLAPSFTKTVWGAAIATLVIGLGVHKRVSVRMVLVAGYTAFFVASVYFLTRHSTAVAERVTGSTGNFWGRLGDYAQGILIFKKSPLTGAGFGQFINAQQFVKPVYVNGVRSALSAHNTVISVLAETGLLGFIPLLFLIVCAFALVWQVRRAAMTHEEDLFSAALVAVTVGVTLLSTTLLASAYPPIMTLYAIFLGVAARRLAQSPASTSVYAAD